MVPLADIHVHLLAGMDDGPRTREDALAMCRILHAEGVQAAAATAHQNDHWPEVTPDRIRTATRELTEALRQEGIPLTVFPCAEVMARIETPADWREGRLLSVADRRQYVLLEPPHGLYVDLRPTVRFLREAGIRAILAHPERQPELLEDAGRIEELVEAGCLVQVSSGSVTEPPGGRLGEKELRGWFRRGIVHLLGSDGHSPRRRAPRMANAYQQIVRWAGRAVADRVCGTNGMAVLHGLPLQVPPPQPRPTRWLALWG
jgi:protein-tyrosine phosphatase